MKNGRSNIKRGAKVMCVHKNETAKKHITRKREALSYSFQKKKKKKSIDKENWENVPKKKLFFLSTSMAMTQHEVATKKRMKKHFFFGKERKKNICVCFFLQKPRIEDKKFIET